MNNKLKMILEIIAVLLLILIVVNIIKNNISKNSETNKDETKTKLSEVKYDEDTGEYYIEDETTGEVIHTSYSEDDFYIYSIDPDYDPKNPDEPSEYDYEEIEE